MSAIDDIIESVEEADRMCRFPGVAEQVTAARADLAALRAENEGLREALVDARESVASWGSYADEYFKKKWDLVGDLAAIDAALAKRDDK